MGFPPPSPPVELEGVPPQESGLEQGGGRAQALQTGCGKGQEGTGGTEGRTGSPRFKRSCVGFPRGLHHHGVRSWDQVAWQSRRGAVVKFSSSLATPVTGQHTGTLFAGSHGARGKEQPSKCARGVSYSLSPHRKG